MAPVSLRRLALAGMVALLVAAAPLAQAPEPAQDDTPEHLGLFENDDPSKRLMAIVNYNLEALLPRATAGDPQAQYTLGFMYNNGEGVLQDDLEAVAWYHRAAEQRHMDAQFELGLMYGSGRGVPKDDVEVYKWLNLAASSLTLPRIPSTYRVHRNRIVRNRDRVAARLTSELRIEGQKRAREWSEAHPPPERPAPSPPSPHPLVGLSKTQIRERLGRSFQELLYSWHYKTPEGEVGIYFDTNERVVRLFPPDVDLNDLPSLVDRDTPLPTQLPGMPPHFLGDLGDVDPLSLVGLTMDEVTVRVGQPSRNLGTTWRYSTRGGWVTLVFEGTGANRRQVVAQVRTPQGVFPRRYRQ